MTMQKMHLKAMNKGAKQLLFLCHVLWAHQQRDIRLSLRTLELPEKFLSPKIFRQNN